MEKLFNNTEDSENEINLKENLTINNEKVEKEQNKFLESKIGQAINGGINIALKALLPNCIEDEIIAVKDSLITEGFSAAVDTAIHEAINLGKSLTGIVTGTFENMSQVKTAVEKGGLIDTVSNLIDTGINWAKKQEYISKDVATAIKKGKNTILNTIEDNIEEVLTDQVTAIDKIDKYIDKWYKYYEEQSFNNMEYQYNKIQEYIEDVIPLEEVLKKARIVENLHELIKNNGRDFNITEEEKDIAELLAQ